MTPPRRPPPAPTRSSNPAHRRIQQGEYARFGIFGRAGLRYLSCFGEIRMEIQNSWCLWACPKQRKFGAVAQLVAHLHGMQGVRGSSPLSSTDNPPESQDSGGFFCPWILRPAPAMAPRLGVNPCGVPPRRADWRNRRLWFRLFRLLHGGPNSQANDGAVAQLVAHLHGMQGVRGSSPLSSTNKREPPETVVPFFVPADLCL